MVWCEEVAWCVEVAWYVSRASKRIGSDHKTAEFVCEALCLFADAWRESPEFVEEAEDGEWLAVGDDPGRWPCREQLDLALSARRRGVRELVEARGAQQRRGGRQRLEEVVEGVGETREAREPHRTHHRVSHGRSAHQVEEEETANHGAKVDDTSWVFHFSTQVLGTYFLELFILLVESQDRRKNEVVHFRFCAFPADSEKDGDAQGVAGPGGAEGVSAGDPGEASGPYPLHRRETRPRQLTPRH